MGNNAQQYELSAGAAETLDFELMDGYVLTLTANLTLAFVKHVKGARRILKIVQPGTAKTISWDSAILFPSGSAPTLPAANKYGLFDFYDDGTNWILLGSVLQA